GDTPDNLTQNGARANSYGQILLGLNRPAADVSRGSSAHDILGVAAIVGVQSTDYQKLYPGADAKLPGDERTLRLRAFSSLPRARTMAKPPHRLASSPRYKNFFRVSATSNPSA